MGKKHNEYQRLPGGNAFFVMTTMSKLYLGEDHLLRVNTTGWTEKYRRFYFSDIQAVSVSLTYRRGVWTGVYLALLFLFAILVAEGETIGERVMLGCIPLFFFVMCTINVLLGPTCLTRIQTRIGIEPLPSLRRLRHARKALALLEQRIEALQGTLGSEMQTPEASPVSELPLQT